MARVRFEREGTLSGIDIRSFGNTIVQFESEKFTIAAVSGLKPITQTATFSTIQSVKEDKIPSTFLFELQVYNYERPVATEIDIQDNEVYQTAMFWKLKPEHSIEPFKRLYDVRQYEDLSDFTLAVLLLPKPMYLVSDTHTYRPTLNEDIIQYPTDDTLGDRKPLEIAKKVLNLTLRNQLTRSEATLAYEKKVNRLPSWANSGELSVNFRFVGLIMHPAELVMIELATELFPELYQDLDSLNQYVLGLSTQNFSIDMNATLGPIYAVTPLLFNRKVPILELPRKTISIDYLIADFPAIADTASTAATGNVPVIIARDVAAIYKIAAVAWQGGTRATINNSINLPNLTRGNLDTFSATIRWSIFNPCYLKIDLKGLGDVEFTMMMCLSMVMMLTPSAMYTPDQLIANNNAMYRVLYDYKLIATAQAPNPNIESNRTVDLMLWVLNTLNIHSAQLRQFIAALRENRAVNIIESYTFYSGGLPPNQVPHGPPKFPNAPPYASCFDLSEAGKIAKVNAVTAMLDAAADLLNVQRNTLTDKAVILAFLDVIKRGVFRIVASVYDACQAVSLPATMSPYSGLGQRPEVVLSVSRSLNVRSIIGCVLGNDGNEFPLVNGIYSDMSPFDSLIFIAMACRRIKNLVNVNKWSLVIDQTIAIYGKIIKLNDTFFAHLYDPQVREQLFTIMHNYQLPRMYTRLLQQIDAGVSFVKLMKPLYGFADIFYITKCNGQMLARYSGTTMTNALSPNQVNVIKSYTEMDMLNDAQTPYKNPNGPQIIIQAKTRLGVIMHELRNMDVPTITQQLNGATIPVIEVRMRHFVTTQMFQIKMLTDLKSSTKYVEKTMLEDIIKKQQYLTITENIYILDNRYFQDENDIDDAVTSDSLIIVPQLAPQRIHPVNLQGLRGMVRDVMTRKKPYEFTEEVTLIASEPVYGTVS